MRANDDSIAHMQLPDDGRIGVHHHVVSYRTSCSSPILLVANCAALMYLETFTYSVPASKNSSLAVDNVESNVYLIVKVYLAPAKALQ